MKGLLEVPDKILTENHEKTDGHEDKMKILHQMNQGLYCYISNTKLKKRFFVQASYMKKV